MNHEETQAPFTPKGLRLSWGAVGRLLLLVSPILAVLISSFAATKLATREEVQALQSLPARVDKLEDFRAEQRAQQSSSNAAIGAMQQDLSGLKAQIQGLKDETKSNTDRILNRLDSMSHR